MDELELVPHRSWTLVERICIVILAVVVITRPAVGRAPTCRWLDWQQEARFGIDGDDYSCVLGTDPATILGLTVGGMPIADGHGIVLSATTNAGPLTVGSGIKPLWQVFERQRFVPAKSARARVNVWSAGAYFWDTRVLDIPLIADAATPPVRGQMRLVAMADSLRLTISAMPEHGEQLQTLNLRINDESLRHVTIGRRILLYKNNDRGTAGLLLPDGGTWDPKIRTIQIPADRLSTIVIKWVPAGTPLANSFADDLSPLSPEQIEVNGGRSIGFDSASGVYVLRSTATRDAFSFEESFRNPARRMEMKIHVRPQPTTRKILLRAESGIGNLEAAVIANAAGFPLPVPVQVSKNFAGEKEEPDDTAFGDAFLPIDLPANTAVSFRLFLLTQNWGLSPLKQVSSVRFFNVYWHLSTGASESTCYTHAWMDARFRGAKQPTFLLIPDFRPMSGPMWPGQPQHGCTQYPGLLQYNDDVRLVYDRTDFESISPLLARFTMRFQTSDEAATASVEVTECPQTDEMRTFMRVRYAWQKRTKIEGDARLNLRLANLFEHYTPESVLWFDPDGKPQQRTPKRDDTPTLLGEPLAKVGPLIASHHERKIDGPERYDALLLVRSFRGRLGGAPVDALAATARFTNRCGSSWITLPQESVELQAGDWIEMDLEFMPSGEPAPAWLKPQREREQFATNGRPMVKDVRIGTKVEDFPALVKADRGAAAFTVTGGQNVAPIVIQNWPADTVPLVWLNGRLLDRQLSGGDYYQIERSPGGGYQIALACPIRAGQSLALVVTAARSSGEIQSLQRDNGRLKITTAAGSSLAFESPRPAGPGTNVYDPSRQLWQFTGTADDASELPLLIKADGKATLSCESWSDTGGTFTADGVMTVQLEPALVDAGWTIRASASGASDISIETKPGQTITVGPPALSSATRPIAGAALPATLPAEYQRSVAGTGERRRD